ncbi:unnamed protein product [Nippostrongylus brasiliensis]|uniref:Neuropeptide CCHamide-1 n=1 Tax=Nippostrongylus brasiliensis TaxID=27835 RepID=A0A0N4XDH5_NIPBR|nr:unnamed protein product [Nippostrongylus brasiliensis]
MYRLVATLSTIMIAVIALVLCVQVSSGGQQWTNVDDSMSEEERSSVHKRQSPRKLRSPEKQHRSQLMWSTPWYNSPANHDVDIKNDASPKQMRREKANNDQSHEVLEKMEKMAQNYLRDVIALHFPEFPNPFDDDSMFSHLPREFKHSKIWNR